MRRIASYLFRRPLIWSALLALAACAGGERAPDIAFTTLDGQHTSFRQLQGKVVLVNFWATSCPGCITEMPKLAALQRSYARQGLQTVAVAMAYDQTPYIQTYTSKAQLPFLIVHDANGQIAQGFGGIIATPTSFLLDKQGQIVKRYVGEPDMRELAREVERQLATENGREA